MATSRRNARRPSPSWSDRLGAVRGRALSLLQNLLTLGAFAALLATGYLALDALKGLPVERIVVTGKLEHLRQEALREALAGKLDRGLLFLDLESLQEQLESLPWVYQAQLRRRFPDTLEVGVIEQLPIARWGDAGFLNHEARIIEVMDGERWQDLPEIRGPEGSEARLMNHYQRLLEQLRPLSITPVALIEDDFGQLTVRLDSGTALELGDRDFSRRLQRFLKLWRSQLGDDSRAIARVDMRYEDGAAVAFEQIPQLAGLIQNSEDR